MTSYDLTPTLLMLVADGRVPSGGHTHSAGVEAAVSIGDVHDLATVERYLAGRLATTGLVDAAFAAATVASIGGRAELAELAELDDEYGARIASPHVRAVSRSLGRQLHRTALALVDGAGRPLDALGHAAGRHRVVVAGALVADLGGSPADAARLEVHHLAAAVTGAAVKLLALDPLAAAGAQARAAAAADDIANEAVASASRPPSDLPANGGTLTEILGEWHGSSPHRMFAA